MAAIRSTYRDDMRDSGAQGRFYQWKGESYISVTNALSQGVPKPALTYWSAKMVAEYVANNWDETVDFHDKMDTKEFVSYLKGKPWGVRDKAADMGTLVHDIAEEYSATGVFPDLDGFATEVKARVGHYRDFLEAVNPSFYAIEGVVFNRRFGYAGAFDAIMDIDTPEISGRYVVDIKTGKAVYPESALQQTAYIHGDFIAVGDEEVEMPPVAGALILHLQATQWRLIPVVTDESSWIAFRAALHTAKYRTSDGDGSEKAAVGAPIMKGRG